MPGRSKFLETGPFGRLDTDPHEQWPRSIRVDDVRLERGPDHADVTFDVTFEDAWRCPPDLAPHNWNAAWLFVKFRTAGEDDSLDQHDWETARLSPSASDHGVPPGAELEATEDGMGVFLFRRADNIGRGEVTFPGVRLRWPGGGGTSAHVELWVHALEMVFVPEGPFELGDPDGMVGPPGCFLDCDAEPDEHGDTNWVYRVESEDEIPTFSEHLDYDGPPRLGWDGSFNSGTMADLPAALPKGFAGLYCMRRQITQAEYCDFINSLRRHAITARFPYGGQGSYRFTIYKLPNGRRATTRPRRACNWLSWTDGTSFAWWAGLRPMTEPEYEKCCRGSAPAVTNEYAWGSTALETAMVILGDESTRSVVIGNCNLGNALVLFQGGDGAAGPVGDDDFSIPGAAASETFLPGGRASFSAAAGGDGVVHGPGTLRESTGSSFYGIAALTGNLWEYVVSVGLAEGRAFDGRHGDGVLNANGAPDCEETTWPGASSAGVGYRGGSWYTVVESGQVADRRFAGGLDDYVFRSHDTGMRCVRTARRTADAS